MQWFRIPSTNGLLQLLAVASFSFLLVAVSAQSEGGRQISKSGNNWDNFRIFGRGQIVAVNPHVEQSKEQKQVR